MHPGASLLKVRDRVVDASTVAPLDPPPGLEATLRDYQRRGRDLAGRADRRRARRLPRRRHGPRQDGHPDRAAPAPSRPRARVGSDAGGLPGVAARQLGGRDPAVRPGRRRSGGSTGRRATSGSRQARPPDAARPATTGSCSRRTARCAATTRPWRRCPGTWWSPTRPSTSRTPPPPPRATCARSARGPGRADRHAGGERPHRALGDPRLGHARAARLARGVPQGVGRADRVAGRTRPRRASSRSWSSRSCCGDASPTPASRPSCRRRPRPTRWSA